MLKHLSVLNFAIIENVHVDFHSGFTVLTGETGAGKSLVIDAIGLLLGDRAQNNWIRSGEDTALLKALFEPIPKELKPLLKDHHIPYDEELYIVREISLSKGNRLTINGHSAPLQLLKDMAVYLADIHVQLDTKRILHPTQYARLLTRLDSASELLESAYHQAYETHELALSKQQALIDEYEKSISDEDFFRYQLDEIKALKLDEIDIESMQQRMKNLEHHDRLYQTLHQVHQSLSTESTLSKLYESSKELQKIGDISADYVLLAERLASLYYEGQDIEADLESSLHTLDYDANELAHLQAQAVEIDQLCRKHKTDVKGLHEKQQSLSEKLATLEDFDAQLSDADKALSSARDTLMKTAHAWVEAQQRSASRLKKIIEPLLEDLALKGALFDVAIELQDDVSTYTSKQPHHIDFLVSFNPGEPLQSLHHSASGGELSRMMLALKVALLQKDQLATIIFDEIDTGVSGYVASQVGKRMHELARNIQVISITHLPQVAAKADHHYKIHKTTAQGRTQAHIDRLSEAERIDMIAQMISDGRISEAHLKAAKELLET